MVYLVGKNSTLTISCVNPGLPRAGRRRRPGPAVRRRGGHRPAPRRDRPRGRARGARRGRARPRRLARRRRPYRPREPHAAAAALLRARVEPGRERLGVPAPEQDQPSRPGELRRHRRDLLRGVELARGGARPPRLDHPPRVGEIGHQLGLLVSSLAILTALTLRAVFRLGLRQTEGLIGSVLRLLGLDLAVPDHTTLSRRAATLEVPRSRSGGGPLHLLVDSTGLRLDGPGEWLL